MSELSKNKIREIRSYHVKKFRESNRKYLIEGTKMVLEALKYQRNLLDFIVTSSPNIQEFAVNNIYATTTEEFSKISTLKTPQQVLAVMNMPETEKVPVATADKLTLVLDTIQDPGNLGTIMRIADWYGIDTVICSEETVDCYNPKVVQASMGAIFRVNVYYTKLADYLHQQTVPVFGALLEGENIYKRNNQSAGILLMGNEGNGISEKLLPYISNPVTIPRFGEAESLNVSIATAILVSEFMREKK